MVGIWRAIYKVFGWEYPERYDNRQQHLKHKVCEQIKKTNNIKKILKSNKPKLQTIKEKRRDTPRFKKSSKKCISKNKTKNIKAKFK